MAINPATGKEYQPGDILNSYAGMTPNSYSYYTPPAAANNAPASEAPRPLGPGDPGYDPSNDKSSPLFGMPKIPAFSPTTTNGRINDSYKLNPTTLGQPEQVGFQSILPGVSNNLNSITNDPSALNAIRTRALSTGNSPWLDLQLKNEGQNRENSLNQASSQAAGNQAAAESNLAMRGGLQSGARERLAKSGAMDANSAMQNVRNQSRQNETQLGIADDAQKMNLLGQIPGLQLANSSQDIAKQEYLGNLGQTQQGVNLDTQFKNIANKTSADTYNANAMNQANQYNISNALNDMLQNRAYDSNAYNQQIKAWAAGKTADAQSSGGKK